MEIQEIKKSTAKTYHVEGRNLSEDEEKYKCYTCKYIFPGRISHCPNCGTRLQW